MKKAFKPVDFDILDLDLCIVMTSVVNIDPITDADCDDDCWDDDESDET